MSMKLQNHVKVKRTFEIIELGDSKKFSHRTSHHQRAWREDSCVAGPGHTIQGTGTCQGSEIGHWSSSPMDKAPRKTRGMHKAGLN